jgi:hypothetical protein
MTTPTAIDADPTAPAYIATVRLASGFTVEIRDGAQQGHVVLSLTASYGANLTAEMTEAEAGRVRSSITLAQG